MELCGPESLLARDAPVPHRAVRSEKDSELGPTEPEGRAVGSLGARHALECVGCVGFEDERVLVADAYLIEESGELASGLFVDRAAAGHLVDRAGDEEVGGV